MIAYDTIEGWADVLAMDEHGQFKKTDTGDYLALRYRGRISAVMV